MGQGGVIKDGYLPVSAAIAERTLAEIGLANGSTAVAKRDR